MGKWQNENPWVAERMNPLNIVTISDWQNYRSNILYGYLMVIFADGKLAAKDLHDWGIEAEPGYTTHIAQGKLNPLMKEWFPEMYKGDRTRATVGVETPLLNSLKAQIEAAEKKRRTKSKLP